MRKFSSFATVFLLALLFPHNFVFALADLPISITEIMYDLKGGSDAGREWVEIQNRGDVPIWLSGFRLLDSTKEVLENHEPLKLIKGGSNIPAHGYTVIASDAKKFLADNPGFSGILFSSSFSLSNTGEILVLKDKAGNEIDRILYMTSWGGAGDGNSIQSFGDGWRAGVPSP
ncbi:MAG: lamin tail domain-containing protein, partial [Candidatus Pacebacteria bacterium]|nr:lamin tail domain-containing protein [Candidatus Paceibacterota bacterium]